MKIVKMSREVATYIGQEAVKVLNDHFASKGLIVTGKSGSYSGLDFTKRFVFVVKEDATGKPVDTPEARAYDLYAKLDGLLPRGTSFDFRGSKFEILGWASRSRKFPVLAKCAKTGKTFKFEAKTVKAK